MWKVYVALVILVGVGCSTPSRLADEDGEWRLTCYIDTRTGGDRRVLEYGGVEIIVCETTWHEPFNQFCQEVFPDIEPELQFMPYAKSGGSGGGTPNVSHMLVAPYWPPRYFIPYEPWSVAVYREIKEFGGTPWEATKKLLRQVRSGEMVDAEGLPNVIWYWLAFRDTGDIKEKWSGPLPGSGGWMGKELYEKFPFIDRPRTLLICRHDAVGNPYVPEFAVRREAARGTGEGRLQTQPPVDAADSAEPSADGDLEGPESMQVRTPSVEQGNAAQE